MSIDTELEKLASFSEVPAPAVTRVVFSEADLAARSYIKGLATAEGFQIREDAVGNTFIRWVGSEPDAPAVGTGSHIDAIPYSGRYDGTVGVLGGLDAMRILRAQGFQPRRSIELLLFTSEEPTRFGIGCLGSRLLCGNLDGTADERLKDNGSATLKDIRTTAGFTGRLDDVRLKAGYYHAFLELHIEQGPLLERSGIPLGVVTAIAAPASMRVYLEGEGGHAGAVLMRERRDALTGAAEIILALEHAARQTGAIDTVATVGICNVFPGAINGIPSRVELGMDIRDIQLPRRDQVLDQISEECDRIAAARGLNIRRELLNADAPAECHPLAVHALEAACDGLAYQKMVSRAYHDSLFMAQLCPTSMLFIPCRAGVSHRPDEYASPADIDRGIQVLSGALASLSR